MKKFFMISALLTMVSFAHADNFIKVESPAEVPQGGTGFIEVLYNFDQDNYFANYSFDIYLPEGVTLNTNKIVRGDCHSENHPNKYTINYKEDEGCYALAIMSNPTTALTGSSGVLVRLAVDVDATLALNTELDASLKRVRFASTGGSTTVFDDITFKIKVVENIVTLDENSTTAPEAAENVKVKVQRTIKAGNWGTICLPFAMTGEQVAEAFGADVEFADFNGYETVDDEEGNIVGITVKFNSVDASSGLAANHPCIIKVKNAVSEFTVAGVTIDPEDGPEINKGTKRQPKKIIGTYVAETVIGESDAPMLFLANNKFYYSKGTAKMKAFRAYFEFFDVLTAFDPEAAKIGFFVDDEATTIDGMGYQRIVEGVYDLSGRKIKLENGDVTKLQKGVYIIDGKKVTIK